MTADLSIPEAAARLRDGTPDRRRPDEAHLDRIAALDPALHAFVAVDAEARSRGAAQADRELARGRRPRPAPRHPRRGEGPDRHRRHCPPPAAPACARGDGARRRRGRRAACAARRRRARSASSRPTSSRLVGPTFDGPAPPAVKPWSPDAHHRRLLLRLGRRGGRGPAAHAIGTDTGGSIRSPAAYCGVVGLKPTRGRVPAAGVFPLSPSLDHVGPLSATVAEAALTFDAIADEGATPAAAAGGPRRLGRGIAGLRLAYARDWFADDPALMPASCANRRRGLAAQPARRPHRRGVASRLRADGGRRRRDPRRRGLRESTAPRSPRAARATAAQPREPLAAGAASTRADLAEARRAAACATRRIDATIFARHDALVTVNYFDDRAARRALPRAGRRLDPDAHAAVQRHRSPGAVGSRRLRRRAAGRAADHRPAGAEALICRIGPRSSARPTMPRSARRPASPVLGQIARTRCEAPEARVLGAHPRIDGHASTHARLTGHSRRHLQPVEPELRRPPVAFEPLAGALPRRRRRHRAARPARRATGASRSSRRCRPRARRCSARPPWSAGCGWCRALVRVDHARELADEQRAVVAELLREVAAAPRCAPAGARPRSSPNRRSSSPRRRTRRSRHSPARPARPTRRSRASPSCRSTSASVASASARSVVMSPTRVRTSCSACASRSVAIISASPVSSATTKISLGPGELVDADRPEHLPLRLVDEGVARPDDLVDLPARSRSRRPSPRSPARRRSGRCGRRPTGGSRRSSPGARSAAGRR